MVALANTHEEFCPSCGNFVDTLDVETGFCLECLGISQSQCLGCKEPFTKDSPHRKLCGKCRDERWLERHADELEQYLIYGARMSFAKREVYKHNRPVCISCGTAIKGAPEGASFCTTSIECRRWRKRYRTLRENYQGKGLIDPAKSALAEVSAEIFASSHRMEIRFSDGND